MEAHAHEHVHELHWHASPYPFLVAFGAAFMLPWAFMFQFVYQQQLLALVALAIGLIMLLIGGIGWVGETIGVVTDEGWSPSAMLMFIGTEMMTVLGLIVGYWTMRLQAPIWPPEGTPALHAPLLATLFLLASSVTAGTARRKQIAGDATGFANLTLLSVAIWVMFAGITISTWDSLIANGFTITTNAYGTALYGLTGIHMAHLVFGVLIMLLAVYPAYRGRLSPSYARAMTMYVHFVNILSVWVLLQVYYW